MDRVTAAVQLYDEIMMKAGNIFVHFRSLLDLCFEKKLTVFYCHCVQGYVCCS